MAGFSKACGQQSFQEKLESLYRNTIPLISIEEFENLNKSQKPVYVLDTRSEKEYEVSHISEARFVAYDDFEQEMVNDIPKDADVVLYCSVGYRSERIGEEMKEMGYKNVYNLYGGIFNWKNQGKNVVNPEGEATDSVHTYNKRWSKWLEKGVKVYD